jgi:hypothetical protein
MKEHIEAAQKLASEMRDAAALIPNARLGLNLRIKLDGILDRLMEMQHLLIPLEGEPTPQGNRLAVSIKDDFARLQCHLVELVEIRPAEFQGARGIGNRAGLAISYIMAAIQEIFPVLDLLETKEAIESGKK